MDQLIRYGHIDRGWIGVVGQDVTPELARGLQGGLTGGALVAEVRPGTSAAEAGVQAGDVITAIDSVPVRSWQQCLNRIGLTRVGDQLTLAINRQGREMTIAVKVAPRPPQRRDWREQQDDQGDDSEP
jgi:S1-C subfamily serine protease